MKTPALPYSLLMAFLVSALLSTSTAVEFDINKYVEQPTEPEIGHEPTPDEAKLPKPTVGEAPAFAIVGEDEYLFPNPESIVDYEPISPFPSDFDKWAEVIKTIIETDEYLFPNPESIVDYEPICPFPSDFDKWAEVIKTMIETDDDVPFFPFGGFNMKFTTPQKPADYKSIDLSWKYTEYLEKDEIEPESSSVLD